MTRRTFLQQTGLVALGAALATCLPELTPPAGAKTMPMIQSVLGPLKPETLGLTLIHEHILTDFIGAEKTGPHRWNADEVAEVMLPYLRSLREAGGRTLVECSPKFLGRDVSVLRRLSQESGLHIITNTGLYKEPFLPQYAFNSKAGALADDWVREATDGIDGTPMLPGFIKIALNAAPLPPMQEKIVRAAARTHRRTGLIIACHSPQGKAALQALDLLAEEKVGASAFIWVHASGEADASLRAEGAKRGAWIELDNVNADAPERHLAQIRQELDAGHAKQLLISQDAGWYHVGEPRGGNVRPYHKLLTDFVPALEKSGVPRKMTDQLLIENPRRALTPTVRKIS